MILTLKEPIIELVDSKKLTEKQCNALYIENQNKALRLSIDQKNPEEIDKINILLATFLVIYKIVTALTTMLYAIFVDDKKSPGFGILSQAIIKGDNLVQEITAASILAKLTLNREMRKLDIFYPEYDFLQHEGYLTTFHFKMLTQHGAAQFYRKSFAPIRRVVVISCKEHS